MNNTYTPSLIKSDVLTLLARWEKLIEDLKQTNETAPTLHSDLSEMELMRNEASRNGQIKAYQNAIRALKNQASWKGISLL